jgi:hypothetical protein
MRALLLFIVLIGSQDLYAPDAYEDGLYLYQQVLSCHKKYEDLLPIQQQLFLTLYKADFMVLEKSERESGLALPEDFLKELEQRCLQYAQ